MYGGKSTYCVYLYAKQQGCSAKDEKPKSLGIAPTVAVCSHLLATHWTTARCPRAKSALSCFAWLCCVFRSASLPSTPTEKMVHPFK
ncbi:uncharacterized protein BDZ83DRAFT_614216 [Colletotrichum acutatum]|uniref:Uncharacterized protein n=1 Tax=Glomerella acutata TaxID=27357 RepID=A0AAD8UTP3_GLOAC|nr:uncharacterized protein BDZ83DRAFT_614216 [Colletotrichum acutatum]KAK1727136.1 hypothetical protein BDZ83DRAFT_614216 [Colletotrichum acutatum]